MDSKLKKCPFCGGKAIQIANGGDHWIECKVCGATSGVRHPESVAISAWNHRADHVSQSVKMVEFTKEELDEIILCMSYFTKDDGKGIYNNIYVKCETAMKGGDDEQR